MTTDPMTCTGDVGCPASPHLHGCHSDYGDCEAPFDHPRSPMTTDPNRTYTEAKGDGLSHAEAQAEAWPERGPIFDEIPSGLDIMRWFLDKTLAREWVGCGGDADYIMSYHPESGDGCHLDLIAHVDHDASWFWLLSVGTHIDGRPTTYDLLFIASNLDGVRSCEWRNEPSEDQPWHYEGLVWFAGQIEERERTWGGPR